MSCKLAMFADSYQQDESESQSLQIRRHISLFALSLAFHAPASASQYEANPREPASMSAVEISVPPGESIRLDRFEHQDAAITIDGDVNEPAWFEVAAYHNMKVTQPDTLADVPYRTNLRIFYTERGLYVSFDMEQPAESIIRRYTARDVGDVVRDSVSVDLDTSGDGRYGYWMDLALGDNQDDGTMLPERQFNREWDGAWYGATQITDKGWSAEFFVPWSQMSMPKQEGIRRIGFHASRKVGYLDQRWAWPALPRSMAQFMSLMHPLEIEGIDPRQQWSLFPYASATLDRVDDDVRYKAGVDVFWRPSSNFQFTATANPDFGSVELDDVIVNLTADEAFFPEKRLFFQEGQEIFATTPRANIENDEKLIVVNTRRIGGRPRPPELPPGASLPIREAAQPSDLFGAIKVTGQIGSFRYGVLAAAEDETEFVVDNSVFRQDGRDFGAFRLLYEDNHKATYRGLGFISTVVAHPEVDAVVNGVDFHYLSTSGRWNIDGQLIHSDRDETGSGIGGFADITYAPRRGIKHLLELTAFDDTIDVNDFGYQVRNDVKGVWYRMEWVKSGLTRIRDFEISPFIGFEVNGDGHRIRNALASGYEFTLNSLDKVSGLLMLIPKRFDDRNSFGNGTFNVAAHRRFHIKYVTDTTKPVSVFAGVLYRGEFVDGYFVEASAGITWRPRDNINVLLEASHWDSNGWLLHQDDNNFTAFNATRWQPRLTFDFFPTARQQFRISFQWVGIRAKEYRFYTLQDGDTALVEGPKPPGPTDDFSISELGFQVRYRWQIAPLSDLFIVYSRGDSRRLGISDFDDLFQESWSNPLGDQLVIKFRYRLGS